MGVPSSIYGASFKGTAQVIAPKGNVRKTKGTAEIKDRDSLP